jgi:GNAT superfamily N-acetyltransferase
MIRMSPSNFDELRKALKDVPFNCLFARSVVDDLADGTVWCDGERAPTFAHIIHSYGMTLLLALSADVNLLALKEHIDWCRRTIGGLWMQVHPQSLAPALDRLLDADTRPVESAPNGVSVQRFTRSNFRFDPERYGAKAPMQPLPRDVKVRPMTAADFALPGMGVSPRQFWRSADDFLAHGGGWCVARNEEVISIAFASFRLDAQLEIGVETYPLHRGRGFAKHAASAIIDQWLESGSEPVWSCRKQNRASYDLAQALGFSPTVDGPYYHLPKVLSQS